jgi:hypothetical protein
MVAQDSANRGMIRSDLTVRSLMLVDNAQDVVILDIDVEATQMVLDQQSTHVLLHVPSRYYHIRHLCAGSPQGHHSTSASPVAMIDNVYHRVGYCILYTSRAGLCHGLQEEL